MDTSTIDRTFLRDAVVATLVLAALYGLLDVGGPLVIPGYLLVVGFDALEAAFGSAGAAYPVLFGVYLVGLGLLAATVARVARTRSPGVANWRLGVAGALVVVGTLSLLFAAAVLVGSAQWRPVAITGIAGVALLSVAAWLAGGLDGWLVRPAE